MSRRLLTRVYLFGLGVLVLTALTVGLLGRVLIEPPLRDQVQSFAGWILAGVCAELKEPAAREAAALRLAQEGRGELALYRPDGSLVISNSEPPPPPLLPAERAQVMRGLVASRPPELLFFAACPVLGSEAPVLHAALRLPAPRRPSAATGLLLIGTALVAIALTAIPMARSLARPIEALAQAARSLGGGDLWVRLRSGRRDEVGDLARAFDEMAERIEKLRRDEQDLLANISHELRTPLARVRVALDLATEGDLARARRCLTEITRDVDELEQLLADLLLSARTDQLARLCAAGMPPLRPRPIEPHELFDAARERFEATHPVRALRVEIASELPALRGDPSLLHRAINNLLDNAVKYSEAQVELRVEGRPDGLHIQIRDHGIGIDAADLPRLATPFFRTDRSRARDTGGVGLGLALARRIIEAHGGSLTLDSTAGRGTLAVLILPHKTG
ncbi:MAG: HAMP domain-containing sensor histidine kinase [Polyangia bacterium]